MVTTLERPPVQAARRARAAVSFGWHFLEMCAAMCLAWMLVTLPFIAVARAAGTDDPIRAWPEVTTLLAAAAMSAGMAAQMRWRGHEWRCVTEMSAAMGVEALLLLGAAAAGVIARADLFAWYHGLMPVAMLAAMALRLDLYTSPPGHRHGTAAHP